jgi:hypothetical protein
METLCAGDTLCAKLRQSPINPHNLIDWLAKAPQAEIAHGQDTSKVYQRSARLLLERYPDKFTGDYEQNRRALEGSRA